MTSLAFRGTAELAAAIAKKEISALELVDVYAARIDTHNGALNAVVTLDLEAARQRAEAADAALARGESRGPLHGVPFTVKDAFETEGLRTTAGAPAFAAHVPERDAVAVARLRAAGAIVMGKTNVPLLSGDWQSFNEIFGRSNNPWDAARTPGGSSGGAAAALAAGLTGGELGSDIGGSIRMPAHFCGLFGHKPSYGLVPGRGHIPPPPGVLVGVPLSVVGPLGRSARDLELILDAVAGPAEESHAWRLKRPKARRNRPKGLRVALWADDPFSPVDAAVAEAVRAAGRALEGEGATVEETGPPVPLAEIQPVYGTMLGAVMAAAYPEKLRTALAARAGYFDADDTSHAALQTRGAALSFLDWLVLDERRLQMKARWRAFFEDHDVLLCPPAQVPAFAHDAERGFMEREITVNGETRPYLDLMHWAGPATLADLPASVAPAGMTHEGLPLGVQIIGPFEEDATPLAVAAMLEEVHMGFAPPPAFA